MELRGSGADMGAIARMLTVVVLALGSLVGCATPDLKPFAEASKTLHTTVATGGDLAIKPLRQKSHWDGVGFVQPEDAAHPYFALEKSWELRRKTMDAVLVYSASLASIGDAAANRTQNATALVGSVKQLASAVPGLSLGIGAAGDLLVFGLSTIVEVKASYDMKNAVQSADPAIQLVARALKADFSELSNLLEGHLIGSQIPIDAALRKLNFAHEAIQKNIVAQRAAVAGAPANATLSIELVRLNGVMATVEPELTRLRAERAGIQTRLQEGRDFFSATNKAVDAWAAAHADLAKALDENRSPSLVLLAARAQELKDILDKLRK